VGESEQEEVGREQARKYHLFTAETSLDWARDLELVEGQSTLREEFLSNRETTIGQKALGLNAGMFLFVVVSATNKKVILCALCASTLGK